MTDADDRNALFLDVKALDTLSTAIAPSAGSPSTQKATALERGTRYKPDGTVENYERIELD